MGIKSTTNEFIAKAKVIHDNKYDYSLVDYINSNTKVVISCERHGVFTQKPYHHLSGSGCTKCGTIKRTIALTGNVEEFVNNARSIHGQKYNYSKVVYRNNKHPIIIICPIHGDFEQIPSSHLSGKGCIVCAGVYLCDTEGFVVKANKVHNGVYNYTKTHYINAKTKVIIICPLHGEFTQLAANHINVKHGCPECGGTKKNTTKNFISASKAIHGDIYDYSKVNYLARKSKVIIMCPVHGEFKQTPNDHLSKCGCGGCTKHGFDYTAPGIVYFLKVVDKGIMYYKIGITNRTVEERFKRDIDKIELLFKIFFKVGKEAHALEQKLLKKYEKFKPNIVPYILVSGGNTELFTENIYKMYLDDQVKSC